MNPTDNSTHDLVLELPAAIVQTLYTLVSGPSGQARSWDAVRALFLPEARVVTLRHGAEGVPELRNLSVEGWIGAASARFRRHDFYERGVILHEERTAHLASVSSPYESRHAPDDPEPFERGINHYTFVHDGIRWRLTHLVWEVESPRHPLPPAADAALGQTR